MQEPRNIYSGSGTPEAVVTARAGSFYLDAAVGTLYHKATGDESTGWEALSFTGNVAGNSTGLQETCTARLTDTSAPITQKFGTVALTKGSAGAWTLAAPTATTDDGKVLTIIGTTAFAHTVTTPANKLNGNKTTVTYAAAGDSVTLEAYQGVWYSRALKGALIS